MKSSKKLDVTLGRLFKARREELGLSQGEVSKVLKYTSPQFLSNFERGLCLLPLKKLGQLIQLYKLDAEEVTELILDLQKKYLQNEMGIRPKSKTSSKA